VRAVFKKSRLVGRLGSGIQVSVSFAKFPAWWVGYGQEPGRVSASFHIFALTAGGVSSVVKEDVRENVLQTVV